MKTILIILLLLIGLTVVGVVVAAPQLREVFSGLTPEPSRTSVRVQEVGRETLIETVKAPGEIEPRTKVDISAQVSARIEQLPFEEGESVRKDDIVARLDDRDLTKQLEAAQARHSGESFRLEAERSGLEGLITEQEITERDLERQKQLYESGDISRKALDEIEMRVANLAAQVEASKHSISVIEANLTGAQADIDRAEESLANTIIRAPMDGEIIAMNVEVGEQVLGTLSNVGTVLMTVADRSRMILNAEIAESDIAAVAVGQQAKIYFNAYPDEVFSGSVTRIALQKTLSEDGTGIFETEVEIDLQGRRLRSGLNANVDIEVASHEGIVVESQAIVERLVEDLPEAVRNHALVDRTRRTTSVVYRIVDHKSVCSPVRTGPSDLTQTLVLRGLDEGDRVIIGPYKVLETLKDGMDVKDEAEDVQPGAPEESAPEIVGAGSASPDDDAAAPEGDGT